MTNSANHQPAGPIPSRSLRDAVGIQLLFLAMILLLSIVVSSRLGYLTVGFTDVLRIIAAKLTGQTALTADMDALLPVVVLEVRLPRILCAAIVGAGLAVSGTIFQGILLNPLADPYTLGVSAGAAFGASMAILLNLSFLGFYSVPLFAFIGAVTTLFFVIYLSAAGSEGRLSSNNLIL